MQAIDSNFGAMIDKQEGAVKLIPRNDGIIAQTYVNVRRGLRVFAVYFWHQEGSTPGNEALMEAVVKQVRTTRRPWLLAFLLAMQTCVRKTSRRAFGSKAVTCALRCLEKAIQLADPMVPPVLRVYRKDCNYVIASHGLQGKIKNMEVLEDHIRRSLSWYKETKESQVWSEQKCQKLCQHTVVGSCQNEAKWKKEEKKKRRRKVEGWRTS